MSRDEEDWMSGNQDKLNKLIATISDLRTWDKWTDWDKRIKDPSCLAFAALTHLSAAMQLPHNIIEAEDTSKSRHNRMKNLAKCFALKIVVPYEEAWALVDRYDWQKRTGELDGDVTSFRGDGDALEKELQKIEAYIQHWWDEKMAGCRSQLLLSIAKNFSDEEIKQTLEPIFNNILKEHFFDDKKSLSVFSSVNRHKGRQAAYNEAQECLDNYTRDFMSWVREARQDWANQKFAGDYKKANDSVKPQSQSATVSESRQGLFNSRTASASAPTSGGASATHEAQSHMRFGA